MTSWFSTNSIFKISFDTITGQEKTEYSSECYQDKKNDDATWNIEFSPKFWKENQDAMGFLDYLKNVQSGFHLWTIKVIADAKIYSLIQEFDPEKQEWKVDENNVKNAYLYSSEIPLMEPNPETNKLNKYFKFEERGDYIIMKFSINDMKFYTSDTSLDFYLTKDTLFDGKGFQPDIKKIILSNCRVQLIRYLDQNDKTKIQRIFLADTEREYKLVQIPEIFGFGTNNQKYPAIETFIQYIWDGTKNYNDYWTTDPIYFANNNI